MPDLSNLPESSGNLEDRRGESGNLLLAKLRSLPFGYGEYGKILDHLWRSVTYRPYDPLANRIGFNDIQSSYPPRAMAKSDFGGTPQAHIDNNPFTESSYWPIRRLTRDEEELLIKRRNEGFLSELGRRYGAP